MNYQSIAVYFVSSVIFRNFPELLGITTDNGYDLYMPVYRRENFGRRRYLRLYGSGISFSLYFRDPPHNTRTPEWRELTLSGGKLHFAALSALPQHVESRFIHNSTFVSIR